MNKDNKDKKSNDGDKNYNPEGKFCWSEDDFEGLQIVGEISESEVEELKSKIKQKLKK